jgi:hypothetical protein
VKIPNPNAISQRSGFMFELLILLSLAILAGRKEKDPAEMLMQRTFGRLGP